jgi:hypothetical protein
MSRSLSLYWSHSISEADFLACVSDIGGVVSDQQRLDVSFSSGDCYVWMYAVRDHLAGRFESPSPTVAVRLGEPVKMGVTLNLSHEQDAAIVALHVAREFLRRWPGRIACAVYTALGLDDAQRTLSAILGGAVCLAFVSEPSIAAMSGDLGGLVIEQSGSDLTLSIRAELRAAYAEHFDPDQDEIVALLPVGTRHAWLLRRSLVTWFAPGSEVDQVVRDRARRILGQTPASLFRLVFDRDDTEEDENVKNLIVQRLLKHERGAMIGLFFLDLELDDVARMLAAGQSMLIS